VSLLKNRELNFELGRTFRIAGTILDDSGNPGRDLSLHAVDSSTGNFAFGEPAADGTYTIDLPAGTYDFALRKRNRDSAAEGTVPDQIFAGVVVEGDLQLDLVLQTGFLVTVEIIDAEGRGISGILVLASSPGVHEISESDTRGTVVLKLLPASYSISLFVAPPFLSPAAQPVTVDSDTTLRIRLERGVTVTGRVTTVDGEQMEDVSISFSPVDRGRTTSVFVETGEVYETALRSGVYEVSALTFGGPYPSQDFGIFEFTADTEIGFTLQRGMPVDGRVIDARGQPVTGASVVAKYGDGRNAGQTETGADGGFLLQLLPGAYDLFVRLPNLSAVSRRGVIEVPTEEFVELRLAAAALKSRVTTADGRPAQAVVLLIPATEKVPRFAHNFSTAVAAFGLADDSGLFEVATDPGVYDVVVTSFDLSPGGLYLPGIEIDGVVEHDFQLPSAENSYELSGELAIESDVRFDSVVLQFYEPRTRALKQSFYGQPGQYQVYLQPGPYIVQVALLRAGGVVERVYEMGELAVESDLTWDIVVPLHSTTVVSGGAVPSRFVPQPLQLRYDHPLRPSPVRGDRAGTLQPRRPEGRHPRPRIEDGRHAHPPLGWAGRQRPGASVRGVSVSVGGWGARGDKEASVAPLSLNWEG
jgi:hypothetical protein